MIAWLIYNYVPHYYNFVWFVVINLSKKFYKYLNI